jgi:hypothetical protein
MSAGETLMNATDLDPGYPTPGEVTGGLTDVGYDGGLSDSVYTYSGSSTLQDVVPGSSSLALSTESGYNEDSSVYDFIDGENSAVAQSLAGVSDPPFASTMQSTPRPNAPPASNPLQWGLSALNKLGSSFGVLFGNHTVTAQPGIIPTSGPQGAVPVSPTTVSGQTTLLTVLVLGAIVFLLITAKE